MVREHCREYRAITLYENTAMVALLSASIILVAPSSVKRTLDIFTSNLHAIYSLLNLLIRVMVSDLISRRAKGMERGRGAAADQKNIKEKKKFPKETETAVGTLMPKRS